MDMDDLTGLEELDPDKTKRFPRCPHCCPHGIGLDRTCGWCDDEEDGMTDCIVWPWEPQWVCQHGIGKR